MKRLFFLFFIFLTYISKSQQIVTKLNTYNFDLSYLNIGTETNGQGLGGAMTTAVSSTLMYSLKGVENIISIPNYGYKDLFPIHFVKKNNIWQVDSLYQDVSIVGRNYSFIDSLGTIAYADPGREFGDRNTWPYGHIWVVSNINGKLKWTQVSKSKSFFHSVATGDLNNDGLVDVIGLHMGTRNSWQGYSNLQPFKKNEDGSYSEWYDIMTESDFPKSILYSAGAVFVKDLYGNKYPEIVRGSYGQGNDPERYSLAFYKFDSASKIYKFDKTALDLGFFGFDPTVGATSIKSIDFNKDGYVDLAVAAEGLYNGVQLFKNNGNGSFSSDQYFAFKGGTYGDTTGYSFREFEVADIDADGWEDIILHPTDMSARFRINPKPAPSENTKGEGIKLNTSIWKNNRGVFDFLKTDISFKGIYPGSMKGFVINNNLRYFGFENSEFTGPNIALHNFKLHDITIHFCNNLIKPIFNTTKYSFCSGDSLKLTVTNINKGDTLKWYYGTKSDVTNISNKTFTDSTKLFVTRIDSVGCIISSDTIQLTKYNLPNKPTIAWDGTQFTATTSSTGVNYQWLLSNSSVSGATSATYKPTAIGSYKIQITDANGCKNVSDSFMLVVTAVNPSIETSADHIAKIAPNPASTDVMLNFKQKPNKTLTIRLLNLKGQVLKQTTTNSQSTHIYLSEIIAGNYIIEIIGKGYNQTQQLLITK